MQFIDEAKIFVKSGDGGDGCISFRREPNIPRGGPNGGDGGAGGTIIIKGVAGLNTLVDFRHKQHFKAKKGENGKGANKSGKDSDDIIIDVPIGTQVFLEDEKTLLFDVTEAGQEIVVAEGGDGGFGNTRYKGPVNRAPRYATPGWPGKEHWLWLKLKLLSDAGLVGLPNAGKSSFLARVTKAKPKIADYPFTTLKPQLGVVTIDNKEFVLADIPGLIEGAHAGHGLGDRFLKHIERCRIILHLIDVTEEDVVKCYKTIRKELELYNPELSQKKEIVALNKCDAISKEEAKAKMNKLKKLNKEIFCISAVSGQGIEDVLRSLDKTIRS